MISDVYHVLPVDDVVEHTNECIYPPIGLPYCECDCKPEHRETENGCLLVIHNSFDGRELFEIDNDARKN